MELICVLVILAVLAALLVPSLTGYIDKAKQQAVISEAKGIWTAAQAAASEFYGLQNTQDRMDNSLTNSYFYRPCNSFSNCCAAFLFESEKGIFG